MAAVSMAVAFTGEAFTDEASMDEVSADTGSWAATDTITDTAMDMATGMESLPVTMIALSSASV
jgi:hypothetical protein